MDQSNDCRIKLAEARGWTPKQRTNHYDPATWRDPKGPRAFSFTEASLPDPENDANDCHALIKHLNGLGFGVDIYLHPWVGHQTVHVNGRDCRWEKLKWHGDDWKQGVCELALKAIEPTTNENQQVPALILRTEIYSD